MDLLLISPPVANFGQATSGISLLTSYLREQDWDVQQWDLAIDAFHHFHSQESIRHSLEKLHQLGADFETLEVAKRVKNEIEDAKAALKRPGVENEPETMRHSFRTINDVGIVMTAASGGRFEHNYKQFSTPTAFTSFETLEEVLAHRDQNPFIEFFENYALPLIEHKKPRTIGVSITYLSQIIPGFTLLRLIRERLPHIKLVVGGAYLTSVLPQITDIPVSLLPVDCILAYDGEMPLDQWLQHELSGRGNKNDIPNAFFPGSVTFEQVSTRKFLPPDLSHFPVPMWIADGLQLDRYLVPRYPIPLPLSRGCYWGRCHYCNISNQSLLNYRIRPFDMAIEDMRAAIAQTGSNWFDLPVDSFRPKELHTLSKAIIEAELDVQWGAEVLLDAGFRDEVLNDMGRSGCRCLRFGLESANENTLRAMRKPIKPDTASRILATCKQAGIQTAVMLIAGFPKETQSQLMVTFDYLVENHQNIDFLTIHQYSLVCGSPMGEDPASYGLYALPKNGVLLNSIPFVNHNPVAIQNQDVGELIQSMKEELRPYYPNLGELWTAAIGGWMTFPACCNNSRLKIRT